MDVILKILLVLVYPFLLVARVLGTLRGSDRLRLREPPAAASCWIERGPESDSSAFFSEASSAEGYPLASTAQLVTHAMRLLARVYAPARQTSEREYIAAADRDQGIPDEVYTLW